MLTSPRWTHVALPAQDLDASVDWYRRYTPLVVVDRREDADGQTAWLAHEGQVENPFVLVLVMFFRDRTADWLEPKVPVGLAAALIIAVIGVLYFGIFANGVIERFSQPPQVVGVAAR